MMVSVPSEVARKMALVVLLRMYLFKRFGGVSQGLC